MLSVLAVEDARILVSSFSERYAETSKKGQGMELLDKVASLSCTEFFLSVVSPRSEASTSFILKDSFNIFTEKKSEIMF
jgi:hypothetical protein